MRTNTCAFAAPNASVPARSAVESNRFILLSSSQFVLDRYLLAASAVVGVLRLPVAVMLASLLEHLIIRLLLIFC
jgi:hypothetical protein